MRRSRLTRDNLKRSDRGAGSVALLAVIAVLVAVLALCAPLYRGLVAQRELVRAANAVALAAADTLSGRVAGYPCDRAEQTAVLLAVSLEHCAIEADTVRIAVGLSVEGIALIAEARAGPAGSRTTVSWSTSGVGRAAD